MLQLLPGLGQGIEVLADGRRALVALLDEPVAFGADLGDLRRVALNLSLQSARFFLALCKFVTRHFPP
jgi:hypothetical protein